MIKILVILGGQNISDIKGNGSYLYYIDNNNFISMTSQYQTNFIIFTLEQFLKKFPYKVGDKVQGKEFESGDPVYTIERMKWENGHVVYIVASNGFTMSAKAEHLQPYKEEPKKQRKYPELRLDPSNDDKLATEVVIGNDKILPPNGYLIGKITEVDNGLLVEFAKKQSQYPKTYDECDEIMNIPENKLIQCGTYGYKAGLLSNFQQLLICRDAYWKIAGEEMNIPGLWKPENPAKHYIFVIDNFGGIIRKNEVVSKTVNRILFFPTKKMRDTFYENFKDLIEKCKELL